MDVFNIPGNCIIILIICSDLEKAALRLQVSGLRGCQRDTQSNMTQIWRPLMTLYTMLATPAEIAAMNAAQSRGTGPPPS